LNDRARPLRAENNMKILIIGCGRVGSRLARRLAAQEHDVAIVDNAREAFLRLGPNFGGKTYQGSGLDHDVLERAGVAKADIGITVTGGDNRNLMIAQILQHKYSVPRTVARLHDPVRAKIFHDMGIETLCTTTIVEGLLESFINTGHFPPLPNEIAVCGDASVLETN
jgi:trk system potassium uptake protein TrkA